MRFSSEYITCLNPCSCGGWSQRREHIVEEINTEKVLILVLVEDGLRAFRFSKRQDDLSSLNPCSCGGWSQRVETTPTEVVENRLNPCSCGGWSQRAKNAM